MTSKRDNSKLNFKKLKFLHNYNLGFLLVFILLILISIGNFEYTGFNVVFVDEIIEEEVNLVFNSSDTYTSNIEIENFDHIKSLKLTGRVAKEGIVKVYFNDVLVLDNSNLGNNQNKITGSDVLNDTFENNLTENEEVDIKEDAKVPSEDIFIDFENYCLDRCNLFVNNSNVELRFEIENSELEIDTISYTVAKKEEELEPVEEYNEITSNEGVVVEESIKWTKFLELNEIGRVNVSLPGSSRKVVVKKIVDDKETEVDNGNIIIENPNLVGEDLPITVFIEDTSLSYLVYYETPGPSKDETSVFRDQYKILKNITVSSDLDLENITSYVDLPNVLKQQVKIRWFDENSSIWVDITGNETYNLTYYDSNDDGKIERVYWNIPHLSDQDFSLEINLLILNIQSYPVVGGNWTVYFNTTGTANLTIEAVDGTSWSNSNDHEDLRFLELKCGNSSVNYSWIDNNVFVPSYNCDVATSVENSKVITTGYHRLQFTFGILIGYADNFAYAPNYGLLVYAHNNVTCSSRTYSTSGTWSNPIPCIATDAGYVPREINLYSSKTRNETIMLMKSFSSTTGSNAIYAHIWNGTNWANMTNFVFGEIRNLPAQDRKFDGCYLKNGDFMAVYGFGEDSLSNITYARIWNGTVWANNFTVHSGYAGDVIWVDVRCNRDRNEAMIATIDVDQAIPVYHASTLFFNNTSGYTSSSFGFFKQHAGNPPDSRWEQIDLDWSNNDSTQGIFMYVNGTSPTTSIGVTWNATNGNLTYGNGFVSPTFGYTVGDVIIRPHPNNNTFNNSFLVGVSRGNSFANPAPVDAYLIHNYTPGFSTIVSGNVTNSSDNGQQRDFDIQWEKNGGEALMVFNFSVGSSLHYRLYNVTNGSTSEMKYGGVMMNAINNEVLILKPDPLSSEDMMLVVLDTLQNIGTMLWNGTSNTFSAVTQQGTSTGLGDVDFWADFEWNRFTNGSSDVLLPNWSTPSMNQSAVYNNQWINFSTIWSDDTGLSSYILEINQTGSYINSTPRAFPTTGTLQNSSNITKIVAGADANITWRFYVNDSGNNWNNTALQSFIVKGFVPNVTLSIPDNLQVVQPTNIFFQCNVSDDQQIINVTLYSNATQMCTGNAVACSMLGASPSVCKAQLGCFWNDIFGCLGSATACTSVNSTYCQTQGGCNLFSANKTIDVREIYDGYPGLVLMYHLNNESTTGNENNTLVHDYSGNNNDALIATVIQGQSNPFNNSGKFGGGMTFRGSGVVTSYINASDSSSLDITGNVTLMAWILRRETTTSGTVATKLSDTCVAPFSMYNLEVRASSEAAFGVTSGGARTVLVTSNDDLQNDTWHHLIGMYNSTHISIWIDGVQKAIQAYTSLPLDTSNAQFASGRSVLCDDFQLNATVDEIAVFNRSFTPQEIYNFYNYSKKGYIANFTLTNVDAGNYLWNCLATDKDANISFQSTNWTFTVGANPNVTLSFPANNSNHLGNNISFQCNITDDIAIANVTLYHNINGSFVANITRDYGEIDPIDKFAVFILHLNNNSGIGENSNKVVDSSKYADNGTVFKGAVFNSSGYFNGGYQFFSNESHISIPEYTIARDSGNLNFTGKNMTAAVWVKPLGPQQSFAHIISRCNTVVCGSTTNGIHFSIGLYDDNRYRTVMELRDPDVTFSSYYELSTPFTFASGQWAHIAVVFDSANIKLYINGTLVNQTQPTDFLGFPIDSTPQINLTVNTSIRIGAYYPPTINLSFNGTIDEVVMFNRSLTNEEIFQLYNRSINQTSGVENFTFTNIVNLTGLFRWNCLAYDNDTQLDWADANWTFTFNTSVAPSVTTGPTLTPNNPTTIHDLNCSFVVADQDYWNTLYANVSWRRNGTLMMAFNISVPNGAAAQNILHNANTTKFDTWNCTVTPFDGINYGNNVSAALGILNNFPDNVTMIYPANGSNVQDRRPLFNWTNSTDPDNDRFNFTILIDDDINFASPEVNVSTYATNFTPTNPLLLKGGGNTRYFWTVTAYDDTNRTAFNETVTYTFLLQSIVQIAIRNNTVGFVGLNPLQNDDTLDDSPYPFTVENDGTTMIDVNISQINSDLWRTQSSPSGYFMYRISNFTGEEGAFNWIGSVTSFTNVPIVNVTAIDQLNFTNSTDIARVEINVTVPSAEPSGDRTTNLSFVAMIAE